ncbi:D-glycero-D-manno-heptose 1,7-bisphosphate phosphatase [Marinospirillum celere]|uniref:D,D-heptose 1,7-bisphosphate phosphatase n=1 Tax=Marinospirillum celere TaxID=1122252 RepID=A0A1I1I8I7_9GAMM|nr:D-glycero-beta-D-manno-heptose 1,7-bisphosphate 7-phosphatase [Marinospirillum celere]SFC32082.1 D-glycero-D-manno-heptose 1,7-bisphosphate phosphatase [Marinospirillum celere]
MNKILILDRDGVINQDSDAFVKNADEFIFIPGSVDALVRLYKAGWILAIATNQSGLARGHFQQEDLDAMHSKLLAAVHAQGADIHHIAWCPHGPENTCQCRKPKPGLLYQIALALNIDLEKAIMVGDALRDLQAGKAAGCYRSVLVRTGKGQKTLDRGEQVEGMEIVDDLASLADQLLAGQ